MKMRRLIAGSSHWSARCWQTCWKCFCEGLLCLFLRLSCLILLPKRINNKNLYFYIFIICFFFKFSLSTTQFSTQFRTITKAHYPPPYLRLGLHTALFFPRIPYQLRFEDTVKVAMNQILGPRARAEILFLPLCQESL